MKGIITFFNIIYYKIMLYIYNMILYYIRLVHIYIKCVCLQYHVFLSAHVRPVQLIGSAKQVRFTELFCYARGAIAHSFYEKVSAEFLIFYYQFTVYGFIKVPKRIKVSTLSQNAGKKIKIIHMILRGMSAKHIICVCESQFLSQVERIP